MSSAATPAARASNPCRTNAFAQPAAQSGFHSAPRDFIPRCETPQGFCSSWALLPAVWGGFAAGGAACPRSPAGNQTRLEHSRRNLKPICVNWRGPAPAERPTLRPAARLSGGPADDPAGSAVPRGSLTGARPAVRQSRAHVPGERCGVARGEGAYKPDRNTLTRECGAGVPFSIEALMPKALLVLPVLAALAGCAAPVDTRAADPQLAGRCKLMAYREDRGHFAWGLSAMLITEANADARRQEIYDACLAAGGTREQPAEMP
jgi:hypothetical protein